MVSLQRFRFSNCCERIGQVVRDLPNYLFPRSHRFVNTVRLADSLTLTGRPSGDDRPY
jgi:hypothetical protein